MFWNGFKFTLGACVALGVVGFVVTAPGWYVGCVDKIDRLGPPPPTSACAWIGMIHKPALTDEAKSVQP